MSMRIVKLFAFIASEFRPVKFFGMLGRGAGFLFPWLVAHTHDDPLAQNRRDEGPCCGDHRHRTRTRASPDSVAGVEGTLAQ